MPKVSIPQAVQMIGPGVSIYVQETTICPGFCLRDPNGQSITFFVRPGQTEEFLFQLRTQANLATFLAEMKETGP